MFTEDSTVWRSVETAYTKSYDDIASYLLPHLKGLCAVILFLSTFCTAAMLVCIRHTQSIILILVIFACFFLSLIRHPRQCLCLGITIVRGYI